MGCYLSLMNETVEGTFIGLMVLACNDVQRLYNF